MIAIHRAPPRSEIVANARAIANRTSAQTASGTHGTWTVVIACRDVVEDRASVGAVRKPVDNRVGIADRSLDLLLQQRQYPREGRRRHRRASRYIEVPGRIAKSIRAETLRAKQ